MNTEPIGTIARVNFPKEVIGQKFAGIAVIKASEEMGFLVWLNGYGGDYSRIVTVSKHLGDESISRTFSTVGNLYFLSVKHPEEPSVIGLDDEHKEKLNKLYWQNYSQKHDQMIAEPIRDACRVLGITKLWKHMGSPYIPDSPDVVVFNLEEKGPITIEAQA